MGKIPAFVRIIAFVAVFTVAGQIAKLNAQSITENTPISFGLVVVTDNSSVGSITVDISGATSSSGGMTSLTSGSAGQYHLSGLTPSSPVTLSFTPFTVYPNGSSSGSVYFNMTGFTTNASITTSGAGTATFDLGATLQSSGNSVTYTDGDYSGDFTITIISP